LATKILLSPATFTVEKPRNPPMPDPILITQAVGLAAVASAVVLWLCGWPRRADRVPWVDAGWPPREDLDRLLALVLPVVVLVELLAAFPKVPRWLVWPLRLAVAASGARVLLHGTSYITDLTGSGTSEWSPVQTWLVLGGSAAAQAGVWALLAALGRRVPGLSLPVCLAVTIAGAAITVMLSGYATGGQVGLPLAAALLGATTATLTLPRSSRGTKPLGVAIVGLFSLLVIGRFFGELTNIHAILLFCAPLLGWLPEMPYLRRLPMWARDLARVILVGALVSAVLLQAQWKFDQNFRSPSETDPNEPSFQDYSSSLPPHS
jgi:hypothetical protein